ncbi:MAG: LamG domain-containing protein [Planctomycetes bacterium]|nr:LamG domain-containing protein [Planctomycetota bacterium]
MRKAAAVAAGVMGVAIAAAMAAWALMRPRPPMEAETPGEWAGPPARSARNGASREGEAAGEFFRARLAVGGKKWAEARARLECLAARYANTMFFVENRSEIARLLGEAEAAQTPAPSVPTPPPRSRGDFALELNGQTDYLEIPDDPAFHLETFTLEAWVWRRPGGGDLQHVFAKDFGGSYVESFGVFIRNKGLWNYTVGYGPRAEIRSTAVECAPRTWTHCALVFDRGDCALYLNGKQASRAQFAPAPLYDEQPFHIGADLDHGRVGYFWNGAIDEVRLSSVARYNAEFTPARRFTPDAQTVLLLHLDDGEGGTAHDSGLGAHHATIHGARFIRPDALDASP